MISRIFSELSFAAMGNSSPNPPVAAAIFLKSGEIASLGFTDVTGGLHAERRAYNFFLKKFPEVPPHDLFVTLEPCSHFGKTPPCRELVELYKPDVVHYGSEDPNPLVQSSREKFPNADSKFVADPQLSKVAQEFLGGFLSRFQKKSPKVLFKVAISKDGFYSNFEKTNVAISTKQSSSILHRLRSKVDLVLAGPNTTFTDKPRLDARTRELEFSKMQKENLGNLKLQQSQPENQSELEKTPISNHDYESFLEQKIEFWNAQREKNKNEVNVSRNSIQDSNDGFYDLLWEDVQVLEKNEPLRGFFLSPRLIPDFSFLQTQTQLNLLHLKKGCIFFLLGTKEEFPEELLIELQNLSFRKPIFFDPSKDKIRKILANLEMNVVLLEGGNFLFDLFSKDLQAFDELIQIRNENFVLGTGHKPNLPKTFTKKFSRKINDDHWEVFRCSQD